MHEFDVELMGRTGHTAHVFLLASNVIEAEKLAVQYFPELEITGNTRDNGAV